MLQLGSIPVAHTFMANCLLWHLLCSATVRCYTASIRKEILGVLEL